MNNKDFSYYEKQLRECANFEGLERLCNSQWETQIIKDFVDLLRLQLNESKKQQIELLNGLLQSIGKTPF